MWLKEDSRDPHGLATGQLGLSGIYPVLRKLERLAWIPEKTARAYTFSKSKTLEKA